MGLCNGLLRLRRGPWEMVASILIALGVFMLMQPFHRGLLRHSPIPFSSRACHRHGDVHRASSAISLGSKAHGVEIWAGARPAAVERRHRKGRSAATFGGCRRVRLDIWFTIDVDDGEFFIASPSIRRPPTRDPSGMMNRRMARPARARRLATAVMIASSSRMGSSSCSSARRAAKTRRCDRRAGAADRARS